MRRSAHCQQRDHRAFVRQDVERARADHRDAMQERRIEPDVGGPRQIGAAQRI
jgi:hypothetical protein